MQFPSWRTTAAVVSALAVPVIFVGILRICGKIDESLGSREVSRYIRDHQSIVTQRLENPKVHSFSLMHNPSEPGALLIQFDVDDKATYELLESDLDDIWDLRFPPQWKTTLRSKEELANNFGYAAWGFHELGEGLWCMMIAGIASLTPVTLFTFLALLHIYRSRLAHPIKTITTD
jgi:hypothetical protein